MTIVDFLNMLKDDNHTKIRCGRCLVCGKKPKSAHEVRSPAKHLIKRENKMWINVHDIEETEEEILITGCFEFAERKVC